MPFNLKMRKAPMNLFSCGLISGALVVFTFLSFQSRAELGGDEGTIANESSSMKAKHVRNATSAEYTVHDLSTDSHTIKEYVNASGIVFAVTWSGVTQPDLSKLFGTYYSEFTAAHKKAEHHRGGRDQNLTSANLTVKKWGHMRDAHGRAVLVSAVPSAVNVEDLK
jgi:hypothetical protein